MQEVVLRNHTVDVLIAAWLHEKEQHSHSQATQTKYRGVVQEFRAYLVHHGYDLDSADRRQVRLLAQAWIAQGGIRKREYSASTANARRDILSSFYAYCVRNELLPANPIAALQRRPVQRYRGAFPLSEAFIMARLAEIDTSTLLGKRDRALLVLALTTGRRVSEVAQMRMADISSEPHKVTVHFPRLKGDKSAVDELQDGVAVALLDYIGMAGDLLTAEAAQGHVWVGLARQDTYGKPMSLYGLERVCARRLGTSKFHALRHTFAFTMEASGATLSEIAYRLGHANLNTLAVYLQALRAAKNQHVDELARRFGI